MKAVESVLIRERQREVWHRQETRQRDCRGRDGSDAATSQGMQAATKN